MKILVTGGAGFIGSNIVDSYIESGHDVVVIDDLSSGKIENVNPKAKFYQVDIRSLDIPSIIIDEKPDVINHHAAQKSVPQSVEDPILDADINLIGLLNILNSAIKANVKKVIFASSGGALSGNSQVIPAKEVCEPSLISPYAITKYTSEKYLEYYNQTYGINYTVLRYANIYGPRQIAEGECGVLPIFMENIINNQPSTLYTYEDMPKGTTRDYVHVSDICRANILALSHGDNSVFNIGSGNEYYIADIYNILLSISNSKQPLITEKERLGDIRRSALDYSKALQTLNWQPQINLQDGIKETFSYYLSTKKIMYL